MKLTVGLELLAKAIGMVSMVRSLLFGCIMGRLPASAAHLLIFSRALSLYSYIINHEVAHQGW